MISRLFAASMDVALAAVLASAAPQQPQAQVPPSLVRTAQQQYKNIQVLKDVPATQINPTMHLISGQLGVECQFCHIWEQWDREDKPQKQTARSMITMMAELNRTAFGGTQMMTCYTCHQGKAKPVGLVVLPVPKPPSAEAPPPPPALPSLDEIVSKYIRALGGEQALRKVSTRRITATRDIPTGPGGRDPVPADVEIYQKAPNLAMTIYRTAGFVSSEGFDGTTAWSKSATGTVANLPDPDQGRARRSANFYEPLELRRNYTRMDVHETATVGARQAYVVVGSRDGDTPERLYFDSRTGLLLRRAGYLQTLTGPSPYEVDFDDYRDSGGGVKIPFVVRMNPASQRTELSTSSTMRVRKVQNGVAIDDSKFMKPASQTPSP